MEFLRSNWSTGTVLCVKKCCGSESEIISIFWLDPNPKKKFGFGFGFGSRYCCKIKKIVKTRRSNT
jgi:hypothetical protein